MLSNTHVYRFSINDTSLKYLTHPVLPDLPMSSYHSKTADLSVASPCFAKAGKFFQTVN